MSDKKVSVNYVEVPGGTAHVMSTFSAISLTKVVEVQSENICFICIDSNEFEFDMLDTIFSPNPRDEYLREIIHDIVFDVSDGVEGQFETITEVLGEHTTNVRREDYQNWSKSYIDDLAKLVSESIADMDTTELKIEVVIMKGLDGIAFVIIADGTPEITSLLEDNSEEDLDEDPEDESYEYEGSDNGYEEEDMD